ncbi:thermonuclease family protein [Alteribacillus sp. HJP-4]|uniref:thermonuclease family protein n=1 Tax=Alteribacillus sp. HJP-4 TaxID=2775394 RepID=UPI0035CCDC3A
MREKLLQFTWLTAALLFLLVMSGCSFFQESSSADFIPAEVTEVVDGDTIKVTMNGEEETIRLLLIDTPETVHPDEPVQPYGPEASAYVKERLPAGEAVEIEVDTTTRDHYDRFLAYVWHDGDMLNESLIEEGFARVAYVYEPNTRHEQAFRDIEKEAKEEDKGIWSEEGYVTEDGFREEYIDNDVSETAAGSCEDPEIKGNDSSSGELIYHVPGGQHYEETIAEEMFCTKEDAEEAGYRPSQR